EDDEEPVAGRRGPGTGVHLGGADGVEVDAVEEPLERLRIAALVPFQGVGVEPALAARRGADPLTADAGLLVADTARAGAAVHRRPLVVDALDVLHDVELTDARPVPPVAPVRRTEHPERRPVPGRGRSGHVGHLDARLHAQLAARRWLEVRPSRLQ